MRPRSCRFSKCPSVRLQHRPAARLPVQGAATAGLRRPGVRPVAGPHRPAYRGAAGALCRAGIRCGCRAVGGERLLEQAMRRIGLSARAHDRIRKVARTIAELAGADGIGVEHVAEAVQYRTLDRQAGY
ncbi:MAG: hypothetical protein OXJ56_03255 [Rhodospirillaceae bacterium]|nr:hypothetical protein [Rhodospirillaceae bacterium]